MDLKADDLVFAKVKGFRPWPARIMELQGAKAQVFFFGSYDIGFIPLKDIHHFNEDSKKKFCKANEKSKPFLKALEEIVESPDMLPFQGVSAEETPEKPKKRKADAKDDSKNRKIWIQVKDTEDIIEVDLDKDRPVNFSSKKEAQLWDENRAKSALRFKRLGTYNLLFPFDF